MGTFVRLPASRFTPTEPIQVGGLSARLASIGQVSRQDLAVAVETPDAEVAERLGLDDGEQVVARRRVLYVDDDPLMSGAYFFPLDLVAGSHIAQPDDVPEGTTRVLLEMGVVLTRWSDEVTWRNPTPEEAATLAITRGVPLAQAVRTNHDTDDRPVRVYVMLLPGDRHELRYDGLNRVGEDIPERQRTRNRTQPRRRHRRDRRVRARRPGCHLGPPGEAGLPACGGPPTLRRLPRLRRQPRLTIPARSRLPRLSAEPAPRLRDRRPGGTDPDRQIEVRVPAAAAAIGLRCGPTVRTGIGHAQVLLVVHTVKLLRGHRAGPQVALTHLLQSHREPATAPRRHTVGTVTDRYTM